MSIGSGSVFCGLFGGDVIGIFRSSFKWNFRVVAMVFVAMVGGCGMLVSLMVFSFETSDSVGPAVSTIK